MFKFIDTYCIAALVRNCRDAFQSPVIAQHFKPPENSHNVCSKEVRPIFSGGLNLTALRFASVNPVHTHCAYKTLYSKQQRFVTFIDQLYPLHQRFVNICGSQTHRSS